MKDGDPHTGGRVTLAILLLLGLIVNFSASPAFAEVETVTRTVRQPFRGSQSPDDTRIAAIARAKREALEMAGTYVQTLTVVKNSRVEKDVVLALTAGVVKAEIVSQKNYATADTFGIQVTVKAEVDTAVPEERVKKLLEDRTRLDQLIDSRAGEKELLDKLARLEEENRQLRTSGKGSASLEEQFQETSRGLTAVESFLEAHDLWANGKYSDPRKALGYLDQTLRLKPDYAEAYFYRGIAYWNLKDYQVPSRTTTRPSSEAGLRRGLQQPGVAYLMLGNRVRACSDVKKACQLGECRAYELVMKKARCR